MLLHILWDPGCFVRTLDLTGINLFGNFPAGGSGRGREGKRKKISSPTDVVLPDPGSEFPWIKNYFQIRETLARKRRFGFPAPLSFPFLCFYISCISLDKRESYEFAFSFLSFPFLRLAFKSAFEIQVLSPAHISIPPPKECGNVLSSECDISRQKVE